MGPETLMNFFFCAIPIFALLQSVSGALTSTCSTQNPESKFITDTEDFFNKARGLWNCGRHLKYGEDVQYICCVNNLSLPIYYTHLAYGFSKQKFSSGEEFRQAVLDAATFYCSNISSTGYEQLPVLRLTASGSEVDDFYFYDGNCETVGQPVPNSNDEPNSNCEPNINCESRPNYYGEATELSEPASILCAENFLPPDQQVEECQPQMLYRYEDIPTEPPRVCQVEVELPEVKQVAANYENHWGEKEKREGWEKETKEGWEKEKREKWQKEKEEELKQLREEKWIDKEEKIRADYELKLKEKSYLEYYLAGGFVLVLIAIISSVFYFSYRDKSKDVEADLEGSAQAEQVNQLRYPEQQQFSQYNLHPQYSRYPQQIQYPQYQNPMNPNYSSSDPPSYSRKEQNAYNFFDKRKF